MISDWLRSKRMKYISFAVLLFLLMGGIYVYTHRGGQGARKAEVRPTVKVVTLVRQDMMKRIVLSGETVPKASVDISPKYAPKRLLSAISDARFCRPPPTQDIRSRAPTGRAIPHAYSARFLPPSPLVFVFSSFYY